MAAAWILPAQFRAEDTTPQKAGSTVKRATHKASTRTSQQRPAHHAAIRRVSSKSKRSTAVRRRRVQLRPEPERIQEIQQALVHAGYLNEEPNGRWDDQTRDAMRRYQTEHGFPETGLPEAKSLMKLGLGPHPLTKDLDTGSAATASAGTASGTPAAPDSQDPPAARPEP
jgi:peptidoglycan hydrolase-like protein with peptidoglycan-binding domain